MLCYYTLLMNYIGSKLSLLNFLEECINKVTNKKYEIFFDAFAGTGVVGKHFKKQNYKIIANDIQYYSYVLNKNYISNSKHLEFKSFKHIQIKNKENFIFDYLNNIEQKKGFIFNNYCKEGDKEYKRNYFTKENAIKCDSIRIKIEEWKQKRLINYNEYYFLLASLLESIDKVANTASVYGAYLKNFKKSALKTFILNPANLFISSINTHKVYNKDINKIIKNIFSDVLYLDPPYNNRQYATNYHILETIAKYDNPVIKGKTGLRNYENQKSKFCIKKKVKEEFKKLIVNAKTKYIFLSYNNEGLLSLEDIEEIMRIKGNYGYFTKKYNRFKADNKRKNKANTTLEYIHYIKVKN